MTPNGIREKFELYRKWLQTLMVREFMDLPTRYQERFLAIGEKFISSCRKIFEEGKNIKEKDIPITIHSITIPDNDKESYCIYGETVNGKFPVVFYHSTMQPKLKVGAQIIHTMYSIDGESWYSSKTELITGKTSNGNKH